MKWVGVVVAVAAVACGSSTVITPGTGGSGGTGGTDPASSNASSTAAGFAVSVTTTGGAGGSPPACDGISIDPGPYADRPFGYVCKWGRDETSCPVAYNLLPGPNGMAPGIVEGCLDFDFAAPEESNTLRIEIPGGLAVGQTSGLEFQVGIYFATGTVNIDRVDPIGGRVEGSFDAICRQLDQELPCAATFDVVRVQDFALP